MKKLISLIVFLLSTIAIQADELFRCYRFSSFQALPAAEKGDVVFVGNSITNMFDWNELFGQNNIRNRGNSGTLTYEVLDNLESMIAGNPSKIFLMIGTNDLGTAGEKHSVDNTFARTCTILQRMLDECPEAEVYYQSILPSINGLRTQEKTEAVNAKVKAWIEQQNNPRITYIDLYSSFVAPDGSLLECDEKGRKITFDGLHLTQAGYARWAKLIEKHVGLKSTIGAKVDNDGGDLDRSYGMRYTYAGAFPVAKTDILFFGDETVHNCEWHELLGTFDIKNRGTGWGRHGASLEVVGKALRPALEANKKARKVKTPRALMLMAGMTDVASKTGIDTVAMRYEKLVDEMVAKTNGKAPVFVVTLPPTAQGDLVAMDRIIYLNDAIRRVAKENQNVYLIDAWQEFWAKGKRDEDMFLSRGTYLYSGLGFARLANVIAGRLNEVLGTNYSAISEQAARENVKRFNERSAKYVVIPQLPHEEMNVFPSPSVDGVPYRIPAIACNRRGDILCLTDYRYTFCDIGQRPNSMLDLRIRTLDNKTGRWGEIETMAPFVIEPELCSFGDPCVVADRESDRVLVTSCSGNVGFFNGTNENHQGWAHFYSEDGGRTWDTNYKDHADQVFAQIDQRKDGKMKCFFIGSGKITQSRLVKVGKYYRLYCAALARLHDNSFANFVLYSDDFGESWNLLGDCENLPVPAGGDEPKAEELPDGSVVISSRISGGRFYNIYTYTNPATGEGSWAEMAASTEENNGVAAIKNSCNGEIMILPAVDAKGNELYVALQSVPFGPDRTNVGIYFKPLRSAADWQDPATFARDWEGRYQVSTESSGYSTMCLDNEGRIAFFYENNGHFGGYDMVFKRFSLKEITNGKYSIR